MDIIELYKSILASASMVADKEGCVSVDNVKLSPQTKGEKLTPVLIAGKRMVLPTPEQLSNPDWTDRIVFHPLSENVMRGESEIIERLRKDLTIRLNATFVGLSTSLLNIVASTAEHHKLSPEQSEVLSVVKNVDDDSVAIFSNYCLKFAQTGGMESLITLFLKRGGIVNGKKHSRAGIVKFPIYEELLTESATHAGVKLRKKDIKAFTSLIEYILPDVDKPEAYNRGSSSDIAPYLDALMKSFMGVGSKFNDVLDMFKSHIPNPDGLVLESGWVETFDNLEVMLTQIRRIPMQTGNEGSSKKTDAVPAPQAAIPTALGYQPSAVPMATVAPVLPWNQAPQQPQYYPPANMQAPQPQGVVNTGRGLDFGSLTRNTPSLAMNNQPLPSTLFPNQQQQMPYAQQRGGFGQPNMGMGQQFPQQGYVQQQSPYAPPPVNMGYGGGFQTGGFV